MTATTDGVTLERRDGIATITIDRPHKANALRFEDYEQYDAHVAASVDDPDVRVIVITAAGDRHFTVGDDYTDYEHGAAKLREMNAYERATYLDPISRAGRRLMESAKVSIVAINGVCTMPDLLWWADLRVMAENATIAENQVRIGVAPSCGGTQLLPRLVGRAKALELLLLGEPLDAAGALRLGLVNVVVPGAELLSTVDGWAKRILEAPEAGVAMTKFAVNASQDTPLRWGLNIERLNSYASEMSSDIWEAAEQFARGRQGQG